MEMPARHDRSEGADDDQSDDAIHLSWDAWSPSEVAHRLSNVRAPWCVVAGWALDLFLGEASRAHQDIEIAVPAAQFEEIVVALPGYDWNVVGDGQIWPYPQRLGEHFQTWLYDPTATVLPKLGNARRTRLREWLTRVHPEHSWIDAL